MSKNFKTPNPSKRMKLKPKESDESEISDTGSTESTSSDFTDWSLVALFDEQQRYYDQQLKEKDHLYNAMVNLTEQTQLLYEQWGKSVKECERLRIMVDERIEEVNGLNELLNNARKMFDEERKKRKLVEQERDDLQMKFAKYYKSLMKDSNKNGSVGKERISNLFLGRLSMDQDRLSAIKELNSTGSMLSDFSYSKSEDDLDASCNERGTFREWKRLQHDKPEEQPLSKKRKSVDIGTGDTIRATTTLSVPKEGPITATSVIESVPKTPKTPKSEHDGVPADLVFQSWAQKDDKYTSPAPQRQHLLQSKTIVRPVMCAGCEKYIRFGKSCLKCKECRLHFHPDCKYLLPTTCIPTMNTPSNKKCSGTISDYTPLTPPMVPSLIIHCVNEIEQRGLNELGLYRIPGSEKDVKSLKEKFLNSRTTPNLKEVDIHVICGCIKDFLRSFTEPILTTHLWNDFVAAVQSKDPNDITPALYETISKLPQPNRDTLAYLVLHLQKVAESADCKMPADNLAKVFGPTLLGYSSEGTDKLLEETKDIVKVVRCILDIPSDFWGRFKPAVSRMQQTPSTDSLLAQTPSRFFTPGCKFVKKRQGNFFDTPPSHRNK